MQPFYISVFKGFLTMQIYKWQQGMFRMILHKRTELMAVEPQIFEHNITYLFG